MHCTYPYLCYSVDKQPGSFRWDNVYSGYLLSIAFVSFQFAGSYDSAFTRMCMAASFIHFSWETNLALHSLYSGKWPFYLGLSVIVLFFIEAVALVALSLDMDLMIAVFTLQFVPSDTFSFLSSICLMFNKAMPSKIRMMAFMVSLHFGLAFFSLYILPVDLFFAKECTEMSHGAAWVYIATLALFQAWFCRDVIRGDLNHIGPVRYDPTKNSKFFIYFAKYGTPILSLMAPVAVTVMGLTAGEMEDGGCGEAFARWVWSDIIHVAAWPEGAVVALFILYQRSMSVQQDSNKKL